MKTTTSLFILICFLILGCAEKERETTEVTVPDLVDRELFFGNPDKIQVRISPDGKYFSYRAPVNNVMNIWVAPIENPENAQPITNDTLRGIQAYQWSYKSGNILYAQDKGGDENWHVHLVDVESKTNTDLTPQEEIIGADGKPITDPNTGQIVRPRADILSVSRENPEEILIQINNSDPSNMDVYKVDLNTHKMKLVLKDESFLQILPDNLYNIRLATRTNPAGGQIVYKYNNGKWEEYFRVPQEDMLSFGFFGFDKNNQNAYMIDSRDRDKAALYTLNLETDEKKVIAENEKSDIADILVHPTTYEVEAYATNYLRKEWVPLTEEAKGNLDYLSTYKEGELTVHFRSTDNNTWILSYDSPQEYLKYYNYDLKAKKAEFLVASKPEFDDVPLANMYPVEIESRDGYKLVSYLTIPQELDVNGRTSKPAPTVLLVHGGPWGRDNFGFNGLHQWLANRGYVVLSTNFRGSIGFGKKFINIAAKEWAGKMHDDLIDAVDWMVEEKIADKENVAIMGGSYGGYATLVGLTYTPDVFACGVDIVGPSNLTTLLNTIPPYWKSFRDVFVQHIGDPDTEEGLALLEERSPLNRVDSIIKPLLIGQGANDPRVKQAEADQIVKAMNEKQIPVTYVLYPDEGHGFARPENNLSFFAVSEAFLAQHIGGRYQDIGDDFEGSSIQIIDSGNLNSLKTPEGKQ
ncbi:S9 family peptidase [Arenibacter algicola]|uniref:S9 family peptidase n=1 Tax=Arenibacter algicola TaxID=616991 RepID=UPI001C070FEC|nr:S9 family peptidase [Arenibacter algicola]MBU2905756.1 S9 family peptidase [Arenibacter algicola]